MIFGRCGINIGGGGGGSCGYSKGSLFREIDGFLYSEGNRLAWEDTVKLLYNLFLSSEQISGGFVQKTDGSCCKDGCLEKQSVETFYGENVKEAIFMMFYGLCGEF